MLKTALDGLYFPLLQIQLSVLVSFSQRFQACQYQQHPLNTTASAGAIYNPQSHWNHETRGKEQRCNLCPQCSVHLLEGMFKHATVVQHHAWSPRQRMWPFACASKEESEPECVTVWGLHTYGN